MEYKRFKKLLNHLIVVGKTKRTFWRRSRSFELRVYFTPVKNKIMLIEIEGVSIDHPSLNIDFTTNDNISIVYDWSNKNNYEIIYRRNRLEN